MRYKVLNIYFDNGSLVNITGTFHCSENTSENTVTIHSQDREITLIFTNYKKCTCVSYNTTDKKSEFKLTFKNKNDLEKELNEFYG